VENFQIVKNEKPQPILFRGRGLSFVSFSSPFLWRVIAYQLTVVLKKTMAPCDSLLGEGIKSKSLFCLFTGYYSLERMGEGFAV
jgi:hypothetical protein